MAPSGKPTTAQTMTPELASNALASGTQVLLTQTEANLYLRASSHSLTMSSRTASGLSRVWSIILAMSADTGPMPCGAATRAAPACSMARTDHGRRMTQTPQLSHDSPESSVQSPRSRGGTLFSTGRLSRWPRRA